jgi:hypothetical protein
MSQNIQFTHILVKSIYAYSSSTDNFFQKVYKFKITLPLCQCKFSSLILSASTASQGWVAWVTTDYFEGTRIKHNRSHQLKHELNIVLVSDVLLGFKLKDSNIKLLPSTNRGVSGCPMIAWLKEKCL